MCFCVYLKLGNHDKQRFATRYGTERVDGLMTLLLTLPGVAVTYNGDEIGMVDYRDISWEDTLDPQACNTDPESYYWASRDPQRTPFQWDATAYAGFTEATSDAPWIQVHPDYATNNLALQVAAEKSFYKYYVQLSQLRNEEIFASGAFESRAFNDEVFGYRRYLVDGSTYVILMNFGTEDQTVNVNELNVNFPLVQVVLAGSRSSYNEG